MGRDEQFIRRIRRLALATKYPPIAGGAPEGEGEGEGGEGGKEGEKEGEEGAGAAAAAASEEEHEIDVTGIPPSEIGKRLGKAEAENQRLKREQAAQAKEARKAAAAAKAQEDQRKAEQGEWKKLAEERADRVLELEGELRTLKSEIEDGKRRDTVEAIADKVGFHNPRRAYALLREDMDEEKLAETLESEQLAEAALRRLAKAEPYLVDRNRRTGAAMNGRGGGNKTPSEEHNELIASLLGGGARPIE